MPELEDLEEGDRVKYVGPSLGTMPNHGEEGKVMMVDNKQGIIVLWDGGEVDDPPLDDIEKIEEDE